MDKKTLLNKTFFEFGVIVSFFLIALLVFSPTYLNLDFFWDDERFIFTNPYFLNAPNVFSFWLPDSGFYKSWPLGYGIFYLLKVIFNIDNFYFYKTFNVLFHSLNAYMVFFLFRHFKINRTYAFIYSLIFMLHPLHVENVSWIFQAMTLMAVFFLLISLILFILFQEKSKFYLIILSLLMFQFSLWIKPVAIFFPFFIFIYLMLKKSKIIKFSVLIPFIFLCLFSGLDSITGVQYLENKSTKKQPAAGSIEKIIEEARDQLRYLDIKTKPLKNATKEIIESDESISNDYYSYLYEKPRIDKSFEFQPFDIFYQAIWHYPLKLIMPLNLSFIYKTNPQPVLTIFLVCVICIAFIYAFLKKNLTISLIISWLVVSIAPYSGLSFITFFYWSPVSDRYTYLLTLLLPCLIFLLLRFVKDDQRKKIIIYLIVFFYAFQNFQYGRVFNSPEKLYKQALFNREHPVFYSNLFEFYLRKLDIENAHHYLQQGVLKFPNDPTLMNDSLRYDIFRKNFSNSKVLKTQ